MLVDPVQFPAPALWQGLMLIVVSLWGIWVFAKVRDHSTFKRSFYIVAAIGVVLIPICKLLTASS